MDFWVAALLLSAVPSIDTPSGPREASSNWCAPCHVMQHETWRASRHAVAATNRLYTTNHRQWPMRWCDECHQPLALEEGVGCASCHVKERRILTSAPPTPRGLEAHAERHEPALSTEEACARCHQFNFPISDAEPVKFSTLPMQNTVAEWRAWGASKPCQACHLNQGSHAMTGSHDLARLRKALTAQVTRRGADVELRLESHRAGHAVPTGDPFRALRLELFDAEDTLVLQRSFGHHARGADGGMEDQAVPPSLDGGVPSRRFALTAPEATRYRLVFVYVGPRTAAAVGSEAEVELQAGPITEEPLP
ncbi:MAG: hypothetical protein Q8N23_04825 [Archangium sp.]|nr:hypothetical protein [Archangium sp.]MDP3151968.1 hypothetical protein [Archangium sp.]MDP3571381.1 hypothetical protein [Archangium sp.]